MEIRTGLDAAELAALGLCGITRPTGKSIQGTLRFERPALTFDPRRIKDSSIGAHTYINGHGSAAIYRCRIGRYCSIGEDSVLGPPEHPIDWLSTHPFAFTRPEHLPGFYQIPEFQRLAPNGDSHPDQPKLSLDDPLTEIGHDVWIGVGAFVKRGVRIGDGAVIAAHALVTRDVPPYAVVVGTPARTLRMRFADAIVERLLALEWWRYDLAPHKRLIDFSKIEAAVDAMESLKADGRLDLLQPETWRIVRTGADYSAERLAASLY